MKKILGLIITTIFLAGVYGLYKTNVENVSAASTNLIPNPSLEIGTTTPTNWQKGGWGTSTKTYTYPVAGQEGTKAAKVKITGYSSGDAKWYFDDVTVKPNTQYTLSSYYIGTVASEIDLRYTLTTGAQTYVVLNKPAIASTWTKKEFTFTTPSNAKSLTVFHVIAKNGELTIDNFSLTETALGTPTPTPTSTSTPTATPVVTPSPTPVVTPTASPVPTATPVVTPSPTPVVTPTPTATSAPTSTPTPSGNLILNPSVENGTTLPTNWAKGGWGTNTAVLSYPAEANDGAKGIKIAVSSFTNGDAKWFFDDVTVKPSTQYTFSDFYKSTVASELVIRYTSTTNAQTYVSIANPAIASNWTKSQVNFTTPSNVKSMTVFHLIAKVGELTTDNYYLNETAAATPTPTPTPVVTPSPTPVVTATPTITPTVTPSPTPVVTPSPTPVVTPTPSPVPTVVPTATPVVTPTPSPVPTVTPSPTPIVTPTPTPSPVATNLISNGSVESTTDNINPTGWVHGGWGTNTPVFTYPAEASDGSKGIKVELTARTDGDVKWVFNEVPVLPNTVYTFSNSYKSNIQSSITVQFKHSNNTYTYSGLSDPVASANWTDTSYNFTTPSDVSTVTIFHSIAAVGWLVSDNYKLVPFSVNQFSQGMVSFNFDDGYLSVYQNAIPKLNAANIKSTQYIISETLGGGFAEYVNAAQVLAMQAQGHEIGAHSITHSDLTLASPSALINEVAGSKSALELAGVNTIKTFAYPYGNYNAAVIQAVKNAGYGSARGAYPDAENYKNTNKYELQMVDIQLATPLATVKSWIDQAVANKSWVILMFHQIDNLGDQYSTTPARMQEVIDYVVSKGVKTVTNSEGVALMN